MSLINVLGRVSSLHRGPPCPCLHFPKSTQPPPSGLCLRRQLFPGPRSTTWQLVSPAQSSFPCLVLHLSSRACSVFEHRSFFVHVILRRVFIRAFGFPMYAGASDKPQPNHSRTNCLIPLPSQVHIAKQLHPSRHHARLWGKNWRNVYCLQLQLQVQCA